MGKHPSRTEASRFQLRRNRVSRPLFGVRRSPFRGHRVPGLLGCFCHFPFSFPSISNETGLSERLPPEVTPGCLMEPDPRRINQLTNSPRHRALISVTPIKATRLKAARSLCTGARMPGLGGRFVLGAHKTRDSVIRLYLRHLFV